MENPPTNAEIRRHLDALTQRQREILVAYCAGKSQEVIGLEVKVSPSRVAQELKSIWDKCGIGDLSREAVRTHVSRYYCNEVNEMMQRAGAGTSNSSAASIPSSGKGNTPDTDGIQTASNQARDKPSDAGSNGPVGQVAPTQAVKTGQVARRFPYFVLIAVGIVALVGCGLGFIAGRWTAPSTEQAPATPIIVTVWASRPPIIITSPPLVITSPPIILTQPEPTAAPATPTPSRTAALSTPAPTASQPTRPVVLATATSAAPSSAQDPSPGSNIPAGRGYTKGGVTITLVRGLTVNQYGFSPSLSIKNDSGQQIAVSWKNSLVHIQDDKGSIYRQLNESESQWDQNKLFTVSSGEVYRINDLNSTCSVNHWNFPICFSFFRGGIDPSASFLIVTIDQMAGMTNLTWRYDLP